TREGSDSRRFAMHRIALGLVSFVGLVVLSACGGSVPADAPMPDDLGLPVPAGTYAGEYPVTARVMLGGVQLTQMTQVTAFTQAFDADGRPLAENGEPMQAGRSYEQAMPDGTAMITVISIESDTATIRVNYDVSMTTQAGGQQMLLTGTGFYTFSPKVDGTLYSTIRMDLSAPTASGVTIGLSMEGSGFLSR
ncbi:MAG: hypothetical protein ACPMAQ_11045, partial [Phycisphaerae bacterium]